MTGLLTQAFGGATPSAFREEQTGFMATGTCGSLACKELQACFCQHFAFWELTRGERGVCACVVIECRRSTLFCARLSKAFVVWVQNLHNTLDSLQRFNRINNQETQLFTNWPLPKLRNKAQRTSHVERRSESYNYIMRLFCKSVCKILCLCRYSSSNAIQTCKERKKRRRISGTYNMSPTWNV